MSSDFKLKVEELQNGLDKLSERDRNFARDLCTKFFEWGASERQAYWIEVLHQRMTTPVVQPAGVAVNGVGFKRIADLFATAHDKGLKHPRIDVRINDAEYTFKRAPEVRVDGSPGKNPGAIYVMHTSNYTGKVTKEGAWEPRPGIGAFVTEAVQLFAKDPREAAMRHGRLTGNCCFCRKKLYDARSAAVGYGPDCADNYSLPWGSEKATVTGVFAPVPPPPVKAPAKLRAPKRKIKV